MFCLFYLWMSMEFTDFWYECMRIKIQFDLLPPESEWFHDFFWQWRQERNQFLLFHTFQSYYFIYFSRGHHLAINFIGKELYWFRLVSTIVAFSCQVEFWFAWIHIFLTFRVFFLSHSLGNWKLLVCIKPAGRYEKWNRKHTGNWISYWKYTP